MAIIGRHNGYTVKTVRNKVWKFEIHSDVTGMIQMTTNDIAEVLGFLRVNELSTHPDHKGFSYVIGCWNIDGSRNLRGILYGRNTQTKSHAEASARSMYTKWDTGVAYEVIRVSFGVGRYITEADSQTILSAVQAEEYAEMMEDWIAQDRDA